MSRRGFIAAAVLGSSFAVSQQPTAWATTDQRLLNSFRKAMEASDSEVEGSLCQRNCFFTGMRYYLGVLQS